MRSENDNWFVKTNNGNEFYTKHNNCWRRRFFEPRKLAVKNLEKFEGKSVFYAIKNKEDFKNKNICIFGGDSALDWTLELSKFSNITLIHRRDEFRGATHFRCN